MTPPYASAQAYNAALAELERRHRNAMADGSEQLLAALIREHPAIIMRLARNQARKENRT